VQEQEPTPPVELASQQLRRMEAVAGRVNCANRRCLLAVVILVPPAVACENCKPAAVPTDWSLRVAQVLSGLEQRSGFDLRRLADALATRNQKRSLGLAWLAAWSRKS